LKKSSGKKKNLSVLAPLSEISTAGNGSPRPQGSALFAANGRESPRFHLHRNPRRFLSAQNFFLRTVRGDAVRRRKILPVLRRSDQLNFGLWTLDLLQIPHRRVSIRIQRPPANRRSALAPAKWVARKIAHGFFGVIPPDAGDENGAAGAAAAVPAAISPKRRGFFFQREADECGHLLARERATGFQAAGFDFQAGTAAPVQNADVLVAITKTIGETGAASKNLRRSPSGSRFLIPTANCFHRTKTSKSSVTKLS